MIDSNSPDKLGNTPISRRSVLKTAGAVALTGTALTGSAAAQEGYSISIRPQTINLRSTQTITVLLTYPVDPILPNDPVQPNDFAFGPVGRAGATPTRYQQLGGQRLQFQFNVRDMDFSGVSNGPLQMALVYLPTDPVRTLGTGTVQVTGADSGLPTDPDF